MSYPEPRPPEPFDVNSFLRRNSDPIEQAKKERAYNEQLALYRTLKRQLDFVVNYHPFLRYTEETLENRKKHIEWLYVGMEAMKYGLKEEDIES